MPEPEPLPLRINHRQLADLCGVSTATVSRALSGNPHVRAEVRKKILREARRLGYQPDPRLAYLSRLRWKGGRAPDSVKVVVLVDQYTGASLEDPKFHDLQRTAETLGYELEYQLTETVVSQGPALSRQYAHRGISGVLVSLHRTQVLPEMDWAQFSLVMIGEEYPEHPIHRVGTDWRQGFDLLSERMRQVGRSIGFALVRYSGSQRNAGTELNRIILAEALLQREELRAAGFGNAPVFQFDEDDPGAAARFARWLDLHDIDCVIGNDLTPARWLENTLTLGRPKPRLFLLPWVRTAREHGIPGCSMNLGERLSLGLRLLHDNLLLDRRGFAELPTKTLVPMKWEEP